MLEKQIKNSINEKELQDGTSRKELFKTKKSIRSKQKDEISRTKQKNLEILRNINISAEKTTVVSDNGELNWNHENMDLSDITNL